MEEKLPTVLVVDDERATLTMFNLFLTAFGYNVLLAENGRSALDMFEEEAPSIVFTDLKMPEMDGFQVLKQIKHLSPQTEVIVITGHGDMDLAIQALNLDATDFINKPIKRSALESALRRALDRLKNPLSMGCRLSIGVDEGLARILIQGTLRRENREDLNSCCQRALQKAARGVLFVFADNAAVNGTGIAELINHLAIINREQLPVAIVGLSENFKAIFEMVGVMRFATLHDVEADAVRSLMGV